MTSEFLDLRFWIEKLVSSSPNLWSKADTDDEGYKKRSTLIKSFAYMLKYFGYKSKFSRKLINYFS